MGGSADDCIRVSRTDRLIVLLSMVMVEMLVGVSNCWEEDIEMCCLKTIGISFWMTKLDRGHALRKLHTSFVLLFIRTSNSNSRPNDNSKLQFLIKMTGNIA